MSEAYVQIGKLKKTFGNNGDISFRLFTENDVILQEGDHIFLYLEGIYVPFFITSYSDGKKQILHLEDVDSLKEAEYLAGNAIFSNKEHHNSSSHPTESLEFGYLKGYTIIDQNDQEVGLIEDIVSYPMQEMAIIRKNVLIPLNLRLIIDIEHDDKKVQYQVIDGLLD